VLQVDVYAFPCATQSAATQMNSLIDFLDSHNVKRGMVWLDIETNTSPGCGWGVAEDLTTGYKNETLGASNCAFVGELISALRARGEVVGTYVSCSTNARHHRCACRLEKFCANSLSSS